MRTTITTCIDADLKLKAQPIIKSMGLSFGIVLDEALEKMIKKEMEEKNKIIH